jgi:hypothetical protein
MDDDIESLLGRGRHQVEGEQIERLVRHSESMPSLRIARAQPHLADLVGHAEVMKLVPHAALQAK